MICALCSIHIRFFPGKKIKLAKRKNSIRESNNLHGQCSNAYVAPQMSGDDSNNEVKEITRSEHSTISRPIELEPITQIMPNSSADTSAKNKIPTSSSSCATEETTSTSDVNIAEAEHAHSAAELLLSLASIR